MNYLEFLKSKIDIAKDSGFEVKKEDINPTLKPHQRDAVMWAIRGGRRALFESFGLGKTVQEIEFCHQIIKHKGGKALIVLPLGVKQEFTHDAVEVLGYQKPEYVRNMDEVKNATSDILITNYERVRDGNINPTFFKATSLDEASVLRSFGSKTYQEFLEKFKGVEFKLVATATPSPNKYKELIHYAGYLEVMDTGQALTRFFQRDSTKANNLTLYPNQEDEFWLWVSSWALFCTKPSDLNSSYSDEGYELPPRTQFSMLKKPAVSIKYGQLTFNMAAIRLFEGVKHVLTVVNTEKKRLAVVPCAEEESASVEWARVNKQGKWVNKNITSVDFVENLYHLIGWNRECRYKVLGRVAASDRGLILVFEMEEAIMFAPKKEEFVDPVTGETKKRQVKYYPDAYKNRIGRSYTEYEQYRQLNLFEDFGNYNKEQQPEHENSIGNNTEGTEAPMEATVPDYRIENQPQSNVNIEEGVDDNGNNEENTSTNLGITGQMGFH